MSEETKQLDPITGLPVAEIKDPITGLPYKNQESLNSFRRTLMRSPKQLSPSAGFAASTGDFSVYSDYGVNVTPNPKDFAEVRAQLQPMGEKFRRGLNKLGVTAGSSFINTFAGMGGVADWAGDLITDYDNASLARTQAKWARAVDTEEWREHSRKSNPHYYTQEELQNVGTLDGMFTANFVSDKLFDGVGFFLGTAASLAVTGGTSLLGAAGRTAGVSRALAAYRVGKTLRSGASVNQALRQGVRLKTGLNKAGKWAAHLEASAYSAMGESALEARETGKRTYDALYEQAMSRKMLAGEPLELSPQELQQIKLQAMESEGAAFYSNLAVLTASNSITFRGLLRPFAKGRVRSNFFRPTTAAEKAAGKGAVVDRLAGLPGYGIRQTAQALRYAAPLGKVMLTEGTEEATQYAITEGLTDFQLARAKDAGLGDMVESLIGANSLLTAIDATPDIAKRLGNTFTDPQAREQFIIGSLIGILGGGISGSSIQEMKQKQEMRKKQLELFNNPEFYKIANRSKSLSGQSTYLEEMERAQAEGNEELYKLKQRELQAAQVLEHRAAGSLDMYKEMLEDTKELTDKEFKELFGYEENQEIDKNKIINDLIQDINEIDRSAEYVDTLFSTENNRSKLSRLFMSKEAKELEKYQQEDEALYKAYLKHAIGTSNMIDGAIRNKIDKIEQLFPGADLNIEVTQKDGRVRLVNMKDRLRNYARSRFGEVVEGENGSLQGEPITGPKLRDNLNALAKESQSKFGNDIEYTLFVKELAELQDLIASKDNGATALRNLMRNPETRDLAISRAKAAERIAQEQKLESFADDAINSTVTPEELEAKLPALLEPDMSDRARSRIRAKVVEAINARNTEKTEAYREWQTMSKTEIKNLTGLSPLLEKYREQYLSERSQEAPLVKKVDEAKESLRRRQERRKNTDKENDLGASEPKTTTQPEGGTQTAAPGSTKEDALLTTMEGQRELVLTNDGKVLVSEGGIAIENNLHKDRTVDGKPVIDRPDLLDSPTVTTGTKVELVVVEDSWWLQNRNNPLYKNAAAHIPIYVRVPEEGIVGVLISNDSAMRRAVYENWKEGNQDKAPIAEDLSVVTEEEVYKSETQQRKKGPVDVEYTRKQSYKDGVRTTKFGIRRKGSDSVNPNAAPVETALGNQFEIDPEYIEEGVTVSGVYEIREGESGIGAKIQIEVYDKDSGRTLKTDIEVKLIRKSKPSGGQAVTVSISRKKVQNRNNARVVIEGGVQKAYYSNIVDLLGPNTPMGVIRFSTDTDSNKQIELGNLKGLSGTDRAGVEAAVAGYNDRISNIRYGAVVAFYKDPNGAWAIHPLNTARLNEQDQARALELLGQGNSASYQELSDLVGLNSLSPKEFHEEPRNFLAVEERTLGQDSGKRMIRVGIPIPTTNAVNDTSFLVAAIDTETFGKLSRGEITAEQIKKDKNVFGNLIQTVDVVEGKTKYSGVGFQALKGETADQFISSFVSEVENVLARKRRQVDAARLEDGNYLGLIANTPYSRAANDQVVGFSGILGIDLVRHNGSLYHGIGLSFNTAELMVGGKKVNVQEAPIVAPKAPAPATTSEKSLTPEQAFNRSAKQEEEEREMTSAEQKKADEFASQFGSEDDIMRMVEERRAELARRKAAKAAEVNESKPKKADEVSDEESKTTDTSKPTGTGMEDIDGATDPNDRPFRLVEPDKKVKKLNRNQARAWLRARGIPVEFYDTAVQIGGLTAHGYVKNAAVHLWNNAEVGTEYHEAFHQVFRYTLSESQRQALYKEARKRYNMPNATELELEEEMAEDFRDYVFTAQATEKSLPSKIRKFFQDILNFLKSLFVDPVSIEQLYSLIESNRLSKPKSEVLERNNEKWAEDSAYRLVDAGGRLGTSHELQSQVKDAISALVKKKADEFEATLTTPNKSKKQKIVADILLGTDENNKGSIANFFLKHAMSVVTETEEGTTYTYLSDEQIREFESLKTQPERGKFAEDNNIRLTVPTDSAIEAGIFPDTFFGKDRKEYNNRADIFWNVYKNWFSVEDEVGNVDKFGWRSATILDLKRFGYNLREKTKLRDLLEQSEEGLAEKEETNFDKIFGVSHFEQDPTKTASQEVRRAFSGIPVGPNVLGMDVYIDPEEAIRSTLAATVGSTSYEEVIANIEEAKENNEILVPIYNFLMSGETAASAAGSLRSFLTKVYTEQKIVQEEMLDEEMIIRLINSDRKSATIGWQTTWNREGVQTDIVNRPAALLDRNADGKHSFHNNEIDGKPRIVHIREALAQFLNAGTDQAERVAGLNNLMWYMSVGVAKDKAEAEQRLSTYISKYTTEENDEAKKIYNRLKFLLDKVLDVQGTGRSLKITTKDNVTNFFKTESRTVKELAQIAAEFRLPTSMAYVDGAGKTIYPYNLPTPFTDMMADIEKGVDAEILKTLSKDVALSGQFDESTRAMIMHLIETNKFSIETFNLDSIQNDISSSDDVVDYKTMSDRDSLLFRLNMFINGDSLVSNFPLPVQETRGRVDLISLPRFGDARPKSMDKAGFSRTNRSEMIKNIIIRDLVRLSVKPEIAANYNNGFHLSGITDTEINGLKLSEQIQNALEGRDTKLYDAVFEEIGTQAKEYLEVTYQQNKKEYVDELVRYNLLLKDDKGVISFPEISRIDSNKSRYDNAEELIDSYVFTDLIARIEMAYLFRGGITNFKTAAAFYKRMGLVNTPGDKMLMQGEFRGDTEYGMLPEIRQGSMRRGRITEEWHNEAAERIKQKVYIPYYKSLGYSQEEAEAAAALADKYRADNPEADHTDGQTYGSPVFDKHQRMGKGQWPTADDQMWEEFIAGRGPYKPTGGIMPLKPYYEDYVDDGGVMTPDMIKNSIQILEPEFIRGNPVLEGMYMRMMNAEDPIHLIHTESAKKGYKGQLFEVDQSLEPSVMFAGMTSEAMDAKKLRFPQIINDKEDVTTRMNRQIRKGIPTMVVNDANYTLPDGETILGKDLVDEWHQIHIDILEKQFKTLADEIGWSKLKNNFEDREARLEFLQRVRELIYDNALKNNKYDANLDVQFRLVQDMETQGWGYNVPSEFPVYQREYQNLIFALMRSNVYTIKVPGKEMVQSASIGKYNILNPETGEIENRELRHLDVDSETGRVKHAEILISQDVMDKLGLEIGTTGILYRIPNQDYSSDVPSKIVGVLPEGYSKTVVVAGNITIQTGSDFDIDKLFSLFRNRKALKGVGKLKNRLLDLTEAVLLDPKTAPYLFKPLNQDTLDAIAEEMEQDVFVSYDHPLSEIRMESNYKSSATLVGGYANAISGWNIASRSAMQSDPDSEYISTGLPINDSKVFEVNGVILDQIISKSPFGEERTVDGLVERLSAALDAGSNLIHGLLNDNEQTLNATVFLKSIGMTDEDIVALLTIPSVRKFVDMRRTTPAKKVSTVFQELGLKKSVYARIAGFDTTLPTPVLNTEELKKISKDNDTKSAAAKKALTAFAHAYVAGNSLSEFYKVIAADNLDGMGDLAEVEEYLGTIEAYERSEGSNIVSFVEVEKILKGNGYGMQRAFFNMISESMDISSQLFMSGTKGVRGFKQHFLDVTGKYKLTAVENRFVDRALFYHVLTKEGSPIGSLMNKERVRSMLLSGNKNLYLDIQDILKNVPAARENKMLSRVVEGPGYDKLTNRVWGIAIENTEKMTEKSRSEVREDFKRLLESPEIYTAGLENAEELNEKIKRVAEDMVVNTIVTTGLAPSYGTYYTSIPIEFFVGIKDEQTELTLMDYIRKEASKMRKDDNYFSDFMFDFVQNYGASKPGGRALIRPISSDFIKATDPRTGQPTTLLFRQKPNTQPENIPQYATYNDYKKGVDKILVYEYSDGAYRQIQSLGIPGKLLELNLREADGSISRTSFWAKPEDGTSNIVKITLENGNKKAVNLTSREGLTSSRNPIGARPKVVGKDSVDRVNKECKGS